MTKEDGSNLVNASMMRALMRQEAKLERAKKAATDSLNAHHKRIKTYGVKVKNFRAIYQQMTARDDGDEFIQDLKEQRRIAQLMALPIGHQFNLVDEIAAADSLDNEVGGKAYRNGARAHMDGAEETECPHDENSVEGQEWMRGYRWSVEMCGDGERELKAVDENMAGPDDAAEGTEPKEPTSKRRGRQKKSAETEQPAVH